MKIIFLNIWQGKAAGFEKFVKNYSSNTDIYCFQEVSPDLFSKLSSILTNHGGIYERGVKNTTNGIVYGQAIFVKKGVDIGSRGKVSIYRNTGEDVGFLQFAELIADNHFFMVGNIHGMACHPDDKLDTTKRLKQSKIILDFFGGNPSKIIGGDFNLMPQTKSIKMFEDAGYKDLIKEFNIKDTRGKLNHRQFAKKDVQYFADYVFVSPEVKVKSFSVPNIKVSDHLPLILDFEL